jgi:hypothetical protein
MKIAIIETKKIDCDDYQDLVSLRCTEFAEVDDETYTMLEKASWSNNFRVIKSPENLREFIKDKVSDYVAFLKKEEKRIEAEKKERERKKAEAKNRRMEKDEELRRKTYEALKSEFGDSK